MLMMQLNGVCLDLISLPSLPLSQLISISISIYLDCICIPATYEPIRIWSQKCPPQAKLVFFYFYLQKCCWWELLYWQKIVCALWLWNSKNSGSPNSIAKGFGNGLAVWHPHYLITFLLGPCVPLRISYVVPKWPRIYRTDAPYVFEDEAFGFRGFKSQVAAAMGKICLYNEWLAIKQSSWSSCALGFWWEVTDMSSFTYAGHFLA